MKIDSKIATQQTSTVANASQRAILHCTRAKELEEAGEFEAARALISEYWQRIGEAPKVAGLDAEAGAEVCLRAGTLSGWIGSARQIAGAQDIAKDLISKAARIFEDCGLPERIAEARVDLAICYWREGAFDEARVTLDEALRQLGDLESEQRLRALLNRAIVEKVSHRYEDALNTHREAAPLFEKSTNNALKGKFHNEYAAVLKNLGLTYRREDYVDQALVEYSAATFYAEQSGNKRFLALVENNIGLLFIRLDRIADAQKHLDRAGSLFTALKDKGMVAQVNDTRARALIAQGQLAKAETLARASVKVLGEGDEPALLSEALITHGTVLARLGNFSKAQAGFEKAIRTARDAGDAESCGVAALSMAEELASHLAMSDLVAYYKMAETELANSQREEIPNRLGKFARRLLATKAVSFERLDSRVAQANGNGASHSASSNETAHLPVLLPNASLEEQVLQYEGNLIREALEASAGSVTRAARMLGITHQGLAFILNGRHRNLLAARKPVKRRRRSIIRFH